MNQIFTLPTLALPGKADAGGAGPPVAPTVGGAAPLRDADAAPPPEEPQQQQPQRDRPPEGVEDGAQKVPQEDDRWAGLILVVGLIDGGGGEFKLFKVRF